MSEFTLKRATLIRPHERERERESEKEKERETETERGGGGGGGGGRGVSNGRIFVNLIIMGKGSLNKDHVNKQSPKKGH